MENRGSRMEDGRSAILYRQTSILDFSLRLPIFFFKLHPAGVRGVLDVFHRPGVAAGDDHRARRAAPAGREKGTGCFSGIFSSKPSTSLVSSGGSDEDGRGNPESLS